MFNKRIHYKLLVLNAFDKVLYALSSSSHLLSLGRVSKRDYITDQGLY